MLDDFQKLTKKELIEIARSREIKMPYLYRKSELIQMIFSCANPHAPKPVKPRGKAAQNLRFKRAKRATVKKKFNVKQLMEKLDKASEIAALTPVAPKPVRKKTRTVRKKVPPVAKKISVTVAKKGNRTHRFDSLLRVKESQSQMVMLIRDPFWVYIYWDFSKALLTKAETMLAQWGDEGRALIRIYDITDLEFDGRRSHWHFDVDVLLEARSWYVHVGIPNRTYIADIRISNGAGECLVLATSNSVHTPAQSANFTHDLKAKGSDRLDYVSQSEKALREKAFELSGGFLRDIASPNSPSSPY